MSWLIAADSSCEIRTLSCSVSDVNFSLIPFKIIIGDKEYIDDEDLDVDDMLREMTEYKGASRTSCPSPHDWAEVFKTADNVLAITISHNLSGSYNAAVSAREMVLEEYPEKNIFILDTLSCAGALAGAAELADKLIGEGSSFNKVCSAIKEFTENSHIMFGLASFENLAKAGRVNRVVGYIAGKLNMRVLGKRTVEGTIDFFYKTKGEKNILDKVISTMQTDLFDGSNPVMISNCNNIPAAEQLKERILSIWPKARVRLEKCGGLCSFYAQDKGFIITY